MQNKLQEIREKAISQIESSLDLDALNEVRNTILGKKGELTAVLRGMKDVQPEDRPKVGQWVNEARDAIEKRLEEQIGGTLHRVCIAAAGRVLRTMQTHSVMDLEEERTVTSEDIYALNSLAIEDAYKEFLEQNNT